MNYLGVLEKRQNTLPDQKNFCEPITKSNRPSLLLTGPSAHQNTHLQPAATPGGIEVFKPVHVCIFVCLHSNQSIKARSFAHTQPMKWSHSMHYATDRVVCCRKERRAREALGVRESALPWSQVCTCVRLLSAMGSRPAVGDQLRCWDYAQHIRSSSSSYGGAMCACTIRMVNNTNEVATNKQRSQ